MRGCAPQAKNFQAFLCYFVNFLSIGEKICISPFFSFPVNHFFFPQHVIWPYFWVKQKNIHPCTVQCSTVILGSKKYHLNHVKYSYIKVQEVPSESRIVQYNTVLLRFKKYHLNHDQYSTVLLGSKKYSSVHYSAFKVQEVPSEPREVQYVQYRYIRVQEVPSEPRVVQYSAVQLYQCPRSTI